MTLLLLGPTIPMTGQVDRLSYIIGLGSTFSTLRRFVEYEIKEYLIEHAGVDYERRLAAELIEIVLDSFIYSVLNRVYYKDEELPEWYISQQIIGGLFSHLSIVMRGKTSIWEVEQLIQRVVDLPEYQYFISEMELSRDLVGYNMYVGKIKINRYRTVTISVYRRPVNATRY